MKNFYSFLLINFTDILTNISNGLLNGEQLFIFLTLVCSNSLSFLKSSSS